MSWQCISKQIRPARVRISGIQIECLETCNPRGEEKKQGSSHVAMKQYWIDGATKNLEEILEEYRKARRGKRDQMWFLYIDLRKDFDEIDRSE